MNITLPEDGFISGQSELIHEVAATLLSKYVPSDWDDSTFQEIINGDYGGIGTTCGYLPHWLIWRLGCRTKSLVNRTDADNGLTYVIGKNIARLRWNPLFKVYNGSTPLPGDIVYISAGTPNSEHVFCFLSEDNGTWTSADAGQRNPVTGKQCAIIRQRTLSKGCLIDSYETRRIQGWLPLDSLDLTAPVTLASPGQ